MDELSKQKIAEENYKNLRTKPVEEYTGDFNSSHYVEVTGATIKATTPTNSETYLSNYKEDFDKASRDFWQRATQAGLSKYSAGSFTAGFGKDVYTIDELLERLSRFIKESISQELLGNGISPETLQENFKAVDVSLKLLSKSVQTLNDKFEIEGMSAYLHGFINTYISSIVSKKIERDKGGI